ncbi:MAG TPA: mandelate racemase/muconate lactonizing enzyme family protein [Candidatus Baltobacteraceae bacterium]|nr:mandelate racemase/muconate lactonizing enzyme family protein [Candidatus Baltobacteraceae bacterium]
MRVTGIETRVYRIPPTIKIEDSIQRVSHWEFVISTVTTDSGRSGTGFCYTNSFGGTAIRELVETYVTPLVIGQDPQDVERIWHRCWWELHPLGSGGMTRFAIAAIDIALWDVLAQHAGLPLYRLLGGARECIPAYGSGINMHLDGELLLDQMRGFLAQGYRAVKMKVGRKNPEEDVERVGAVRRLIGSNIQLMLDANQVWTAGEAIQRIRMLQPFDPYWMEEPILADDRAGHVQIRQATGVPVAVGETLYTRYEFADYLRAGAVDIVQADVCRVGGFTEWLKIAHLAASFNVPVAPHFVMELSAHALCAVPNGLILEDLQGGSLTDLGVLVEPIRVLQGEMRPPQRPGHGIVFDAAKLRPFEVTGKLTGVQPART